MDLLTAVLVTLGIGIGLSLEYLVISGEFTLED